MNERKNMLRAEESSHLHRSLDRLSLLLVYFRKATILGSREKQKHDRGAEGVFRCGIK